VAINADSALEREADSMGAAAWHSRGAAAAPHAAAAPGGVAQRVNGGAAAPAAGAAPPAAVPAAPAQPSRQAADERMAHENPTRVAVEPWATANYKPVNAKLRLTFPATAWGELEVHIHWGPGTRWWNAAPAPTFKQGALSLGHLQDGAFKTWAVGQIDAHVPTVALMDLLRRRNTPGVTTALIATLRAEAMVAGTRVTARNDMMTLAYDNAWLPSAYWDAGAHLALGPAIAAAAAPLPAAAPAHPVVPAAAPPAAAAATPAATPAATTAATTNHSAGSAAAAPTTK
jgi:hypothetical protein